MKLLTGRVIPTAVLIRRKVLYNDPNALRALWRQSSGNREKAYDVIRRTAAHWTSVPVSDADIEIALGELNGGCEVEWKS